MNQISIIKYILTRSHISKSSDCLSKYRNTNGIFSGFHLRFCSISPILSTLILNKSDINYQIYSHMSTSIGKSSGCVSKYRNFRIPSAYPVLFVNIASCLLWMNEISIIKNCLKRSPQQIIFLRQQTQKFQDLICVSCAICQHCILSALDEWYKNFHFASTLCIQANQKACRYFI